MYRLSFGSAIIAEPQIGPRMGGIIRLLAVGDVDNVPLVIKGAADALTVERAFVGTFVGTLKSIFYPIDLTDKFPTLGGYP